MSRYMSVVIQKLFVVVVILSMWLFAVLVRIRWNCF